MRQSLFAATAVATLAALPANAQNAGLLGDAGGLRPALAAHGITLTLSDSENLLGLLSGGVKRGATLQGVATAGLDVDTGKAFGLGGGDFHISALQLHGRVFTPYYLAAIQPANGNEGDNATRLWEMWYDQSFAGGLWDIKLGQQSIDNEFMGSANSGIFVDTMAGWPGIPSYDLYGGGPAYPLSSLGVRLRLQTAQTALLGGVYDDNPGGGAFADDAQMLDNNGGRFSLRTGALYIVELQQQMKFFGQPGTYKLGAWFDSGTFSDQRFGTDGLSLADPASNGDARPHHGNESLYAVADQSLWQSGPRTLNIFMRIMGAPAPQNLIDFAANGGLTLAAPLASRTNDTLGLNIGVVRVSPRAAALDRDSSTPARGTETTLELTYQAQATPWLILQPDLQYIFAPGGGIQNPNGSGAMLHNELVAGIRGVVSF